MEKKYVVDFLNNTIFSHYYNAKTGDEKVEDDKFRSFVYELFSVYSIKPVKEKINVQKDDNVLAIDMLNEIAKCPKELFDLLNENDKKQFRAQRDEFDVKENRVVNEDQSTQTQYDKNISDEPIDTEENKFLVRSGDRFPYLAVKYLDENVFKNTGFLLNIGKYRFKFYDRYLLDGTSDLRIRQKVFNLFGKRKDVEEWRKNILAREGENKVRVKGVNDYIKDNSLYNEIETKLPDDEDSEIIELMKDTPDSEPYITDTRTHYVFTQHNMFLKFNVSNPVQNPNYQLLYAENADDTNGKYEGEKLHLDSADCSLSVYDLPGVLFLQYLNERYAQSINIEDLIKNHCNSFKRLLSDIKTNDLKGKAPNLKEEYGLNYNDIPKKIKDYLQKGDCGKDFISHVSLLANKEIANIKKREEQINDKTKPLDNRAGKLADWLCDDIIKYQPWNPNKKNDPKLSNGEKITGKDFQNFQQTIAQYHGNYQELKIVLKNAGFIDGQYTHPFLCNIKFDKSLSNFQNLYKSYLREKKIYFLSLKNADKKTLNKIQFLRHHKYENKGKKQLVAGYWNEEKNVYKPIAIPTSLFVDEILKIFNSVDELKNNENIKSELTKTRKDNNKISVSELINLFFKYVLKDESQSFYFANRTYAKIFQVKKENKFANQEFSVNDLIEKEKSKNHKSILADMKAMYGEGNYDKKEQLFKDFLNNQKCLRNHQIQDKILFLCSKSILEKMLNHNEEGTNIDLGNMKLQDVKSIGGVDNHRSTTSDLSNLEKRNYNILNLPVHFEVTIYDRLISKDNVRIKDFGMYYSLLDDPRIFGLLKSVTDCSTPINMTDIEKELALFDSIRPQVLGLSHKYEDSKTRPFYDEAKKEISDLVNLNKLQVNDKGKPEQKHNTPDFGQIVNSSTLTKKDKELYKNIRDCFAHGLYPTEGRNRDAFNLIANEPFGQKAQKLLDEFKKLQ